MGRLQPVAWLRSHPLAADGLLAVVLAAAAVPGLWVEPLPGIDQNEPDAWAVVLVLLQTLPLVARRRLPVTVLVVTMLAAGANLVADYPATIGLFGSLIATYSVAAHLDRPRSIYAGLFAVVAVNLVFLGGWLTNEPEVNLDTIVSNLLMFGLAWFVGDNLRVRRQYVHSIEERARLLEAERDARARQAVAAERRRIARELHDVVAHGVSVMVVQASGARRMLGTRPERAGEALDAIEQTGRQALAELRRLVGVLRETDEDDTALTPQPGIDAVPDLVHECRTAGQEVELSVDGTPRSVPTGVDVSAYRVIQEGLTNVRKHAGLARARVRLVYGDDELLIEVVDDGRGAAAASVDEPGHGLVGMRERVALFGGELHTGPRTGGGYEVRARFPLPKGAPPPGAPARDHSAA